MVENVRVVSQKGEVYPQWIKQETGDNIVRALRGQENLTKQQLAAQKNQPELLNQIREQQGIDTASLERAGNTIMDDLGLVVKGAGNRIKDFAAMVTNMDGTLQSLNPAVERGIQGIFDGLRLPAVGAVIAGVATTATAWIDNATQSYRRILAAGTELEGGFADLAETAYRSRMTMQEFSDYVYRNARVVAVAGIRRVGEFHEQAFDILEPFQMYGMQLDEMRETTGDYMEMLRTTGRWQQIHSQHAAVGYQQFIDAALTVARITGETRGDVLDRAFSNLKERTNQVALAFLEMSDPEAARSIANIQGEIAALPKQFSGLGETISQVILRGTTAITETGQTLNVYAPQTAAAFRDLGNNAIDMQTALATMQGEFNNMSKEQLRTLSMTNSELSNMMIDMWMSTRGIDFTGDWKTQMEAMADQTGGVTAGLSVEATMRKLQMDALEEGTKVLRTFIGSVGDTDTALKNFVKWTNALDINSWADNIREQIADMGISPEKAQDFLDLSFRARMGDEEASKELAEVMASAQAKLSEAVDEGVSSLGVLGEMGDRFVNWVADQFGFAPMATTREQLQPKQAQFSDEQINKLQGSMSSAAESAALIARFSYGRQTEEDIQKLREVLGEEATKSIIAQYETARTIAEVVKDRETAQAAASLTQSVENLMGATEKSQQQSQQDTEEIKNTAAEVIRSSDRARRAEPEVSVEPPVVPIDYEMLTRSVSGAVSPWMVTENEKSVMLANKLDSVVVTTSHMSEMVAGLREVASGKTISLPPDFYTTLEETVRRPGSESPPINSADWREFMTIQRDSVETQRQIVFMVSELNVNMNGLQRQFKELGLSLS